MMTNGSGHVQLYFILAAVIPIRLSGQQIWINYRGLRMGGWGQKKNGAHLFHHGSNHKTAPLKPNDTRLTPKSRRIISHYLVMF